MELGLFVVGEFVGLRGGGTSFPKLRVRVGEPEGDRPGFEEWIEYRAYSSATGESLLPVDLQPGTFVRCRVRVVPKSAASGPFAVLALLALDVVSLA